MTHNKDYVFYDNAFMTTMKAPMKQFQVSIIGTKDYIFLVPNKSMGFFVIVSTMKNHQYFDGATVQEGLKRLIDEAESIEGLENSLKALLEDDTKYIYDLNSLKRFKFGGFLGRQTLRMDVSKLHKTNVSPKKKKDSKEFRAFYENLR